MSARWEGLKRVFRLPLGRRGVEADVVEELRFHLEERIEELVSKGLSRAEAEREARARFGDLLAIGAALKQIDRRMVRRKSLGESLEALARDLRFGFRALRRHPGFTVTAVLTLGLGMGATGSIFTLLQRVVLDPLPYPSAERLVRLKNPVPGVGKGEEWNLSAAQVFYYGAHAPSLAELGGYRQSEFSLQIGAEPSRVQVASVTAGMLHLLGARALRGRLLDANDDRTVAAAVVMLGYGFWRTQFGGDEAVLGKTIRVDEQPMVVIGVMAPDIELPPDRGEGIHPRAELWTVMRLNPAGPFYNNHWIPVVARLARGATVATAQRELDRLLPQLPEAFPLAYGAEFLKRYGFHSVVYPLKRYVLGDMARNLWILLAAVGLVLVIACANVVNLLLVRLETRRREVAVRSALGAGRGAIAREALAEGCILALSGGTLAALLSVASTRWLVALAPAGIPRLESVAFDGKILLVLLALALLIAGALAAVPALQYRGVTALSALGEGGRAGTAAIQQQRLRGMLVVTQVALALMLVVGSSLLLRSFQRLRSVDPGLDPRGVLTFDWYLPNQRYDRLTKVWQFHDAVLQRIRALPGVLAAGASEELPLLTGFGCTVQGFEERVVYDRIKAAGLTTCSGQAPTTPGYFETLRIPLVSGRYFTDADNTAPERGAVIVTRAFAGRFWPGENPLGKGLRPNGRGEPPFYRVVGVVGDLQGTALDDPPAMGAFYPIVPMPGRERWYPSAMHVVVRTARGDPLALLPAIRRIVNEVDPTIPLANAELMSTVVHRSMGRLSFTMLLLGIAGGVALGLAAIGLYGLISFVVARRTNEIGVRIALGAPPRQVEGLVVGGALKLAGLGLLIGLAGAAASAGVLGGLLYGVAPWDPASYLGAVLMVLVVAGLAGWIPARRAARVDPVEALREE
jgi:putative ABC transport system permease protein